MLSAADQPPGTFSTLESIPRGQLSAAERRFAEAKEAELIDFIKESAEKKLQAIQYAEFNSIICASVRTESEIAIPTALPEKPFGWWSESYDQHLMYISWQRGTANVISADFKNDANIPQSVLRERFKQLMSGIAEAFGELKRRNRDARLSNESVRAALDLITRRDHEAIIEYLTTMGYGGPRHLKEHTGISPSVEVIRQYVESVIAASNAVGECRGVDQSAFAEVITPHVAHRIRSAISLMEDIRYFISTNKRSDYAQKLKRIESVGFERAAKDPYFALDLGFDKSAGNMQKVARSYIGNTRAPPKRPSSALSLSPSPSVDRLGGASAIAAQFQESTLQMPPALQKFPPVIEEAKAGKRYSLSSQSSMRELPSPRNEKKERNERNEKNEKNERRGRAKAKVHEIELRPRVGPAEEFVGAPKLGSKEELPLRVSATMVIVSIGHVVYNPSSYHSERYIYPPGYVSEKLHPSLEAPSERIWYRSMVLEDGDRPLFRVEVADNPSIFFEGPSPSTPWIKLIKRIEERKKELGMPYTNRPSISGPESFGFTIPAVKRMVARLPNADRCVNFKQLNEYADDDEVMPSRGRKTVRFYETSSESESEPDSDSEEGVNMNLSMNANVNVGMNMNERKERKERKEKNDRRETGVAGSEKRGVKRRGAEGVSLRVNFGELIKSKKEDEIHLKFPNGSDFASFLGQH